MVASAEDGAGGASPTLRVPPMNEDGHVLKSHRGLLAAGLTVAVVGALGIASTTNADAEPIPYLSADSPSPAASEPTPPPRLPWGALPGRLKIGKPGMSSGELRAAGLDAAPPVTTASIGHGQAVAPKGFVRGSTYLRSAPAAGQLSSTAGRSNAVSALNRPTPAAPSPPPKDGPNYYYFYSMGVQELYKKNLTTTNLFANLLVTKPKLNGDGHSLAELILQSADTHQAVEVGWTVDVALNHDYEPHLFVYYWVNGQGPTGCPADSHGYNCNFKPQAGVNVHLGDTLALNTYQQFGIQFYSGNWWIVLNSVYLGYLPGSLWSAAGVTFNAAGNALAYGEVAAVDNTTPCAQMGTGILPSNGKFNPAIANFGSIYIDVPTDMSFSSFPATPFYAAVPAVGDQGVSKSTFYFGGPGAC